MLAGVQLGAVDFLERPLSFAKLKTLWTHKIRGMMARGNGGVLPRAPSCPQLDTPAAAGAAGGASGADTPWPGSGGGMPRSGSVPGFSCPATPSVPSHAPAAAQPSSSLGSGNSGQVAGGCSEATSGAPQAAAADAAATPVNAPVLPLVPVPPTQPAAASRLPAAPLACLQLGATGDALPAVVHWPSLPGGTTWGTPVGCGVPPPALPGSPGAAEAAAAELPQLSIKWCPPGALPAPASTHELLLPEDFSLARIVAPEQAPERAVGGASGASTAAGGQGPLGLRLTVCPTLLADINSCLAARRGPRVQAGHDALLAPAAAGASA